MEYKIGTIVFEDWEIIKLIGEGSYGTVFEIQKSNYGITTRSALKVITIPQTQSDVKYILSDGLDVGSATAYFKGFVDELVKEVMIMSTVKNHSNIVSYEDHQVIEHEGEIGWDILIRMELLTPLPDYQMQHKLSEWDVMRLGYDVSDALTFCENKGIIHRDIKPENIFVNEIGQFKIGDFGVARVVDKTTGGFSKKGTELYMAPEIYRGQAYGKSVDTYSLGLVMYRLLNGNRLPFFPLAPNPITFSDREQAIARRMKGEVIPKVNTLNAELAEVVGKACSFSPEDRFLSAKEMHTALKGISKKSFSEPEMGNDKTVSMFQLDVGKMKNDKTSKNSKGALSDKSVEGIHLDDALTSSYFERFLPALDNLDRSIAYAQKNYNAEYAKGLDKIRCQILDVFASEGIMPIEALHQTFSVEYHNAMTHVEDASYGENIVIEEYQRGYMQNGKVIRYSLVKVAN